MKSQRFTVFGVCAFVVGTMLGQAFFANAAFASDASTRDAEKKADASAETFLRRVYATYKLNQDPPLLEDIATPALRSLLHQEQEALDGEVGVLDSDPLCNCQDFDIKVQGIRFDHASEAHTTAIVTFTNFDKHSESVQLELAKVGGVWRIDDVGGLQKALQDELKSLKKP